MLARSLARSLAVTLALPAAAAITSMASAVAPFLTIESAENAPGGGGAALVASGVSGLLDPASPITLVANSVSRVADLGGGATETGPLEAYGTFTNGNVTPGASLPAANQSNPAKDDEFFAGGIGIESGLILSTGICSDTDNENPGLTSQTGRGVGAEGPNNGFAIVVPALRHEGEVSEELLGENKIDIDFFNAMSGDVEPRTGDPVVVEFKVNLASPGYLRVDYAFASDEFPHWVDDKNDSYVILVKPESRPSGSFENIAVFRNPLVVDSETGEVIDQPFSLQALRDCPTLFRKNQIAPAPVELVGSLHTITGITSFYDHEYGGASIPLTAETQMPLAPGTYTLKVVVQDVGDAIVDAAIFLAQGGVKLFSLKPADFNADGSVDLLDLDILGANFGSQDASFIEGDANGDGAVNLLDLDVLGGSFGQAGNANFSADFNRDGVVDDADHDIWEAFQGNTLSCANRFQGDADDDGDVDAHDEVLWVAQSGSGGGASMMMVGGGGMTLGESAAAASRSITGNLEAAVGAIISFAPPVFPTDRDMNDDGVVDATDIPLIRAYLEGGSAE